MVISKHPMLFTLPSSMKSARYSGRNEGMELSSLFIKPTSIAQHLCDTNHLTSTSLSFLTYKMGTTPCSMDGTAYYRELPSLHTKTKIPLPFLPPSHILLNTCKDLISAQGKGHQYLSLRTMLCCCFVLIRV